MRPTCWHQKFGTNGLSAPAQGLCLNVFSSIAADFNISSAIRWAIQDQWSSVFFCFFFFSVKIDATNFVPSNTAEVWSIYLKMGHIMRKPVFCHMWTTKAQISLHIHVVWSAPLLFATWIVTRFYSSKQYSSIGTYTVSPTCQFAESVFRYMYICLSVSFTLQERCYTDCVSLCRFFVINRFDKK